MTSPPPDPLIIPERGARPTCCGGKATFLLDIAPLVAVPEFVVVPPSWFTLAAAPQLADIAACWSRWNTVYRKSVQSWRRLASVQFTPVMRERLTTQLKVAMPDVTLFAVRSSAVDEDGARHSFAGLYDTALNVRSAGLEQAVIAVWRSWFSVRAIIHRDADDWQPVVMAVVIQHMIEAVEAGVAAVYGDTVEVESVVGTGDRLVNGSVEPVRRLFLAPLHSPQSSAEHAAAAALTLRDQLDIGDLDVEWAADRDGVWIVQARPLTAQPPPAAGLSWISSCTQPILRTAELYADCAPGDVLPLEPVAEVVGHYRSKRRPLYAIGAEHDCDLGAAFVVHFNPLGLEGQRWADLVGRLGPHIILDLSASERQVIITVSDLHQYLLDHCGDDPQRLRSVVVREFIAGGWGAVSALCGADVRVEFSREGLLSLNRGTAAADEFIIPHGGSFTAAPAGWSHSTLTVIDRVTRQLVDRHGDAVVEWVLRTGRPVLVDYSLIGPGSTSVVPANHGMVISSGSCRGPALVIPSSATQVLTEDSVAPVVSVGARLPHPSLTAVNDVHEVIMQLEHRPVVFVDRPYAVLATLIPYVAGFVFTQPAARLCHLAILLRENGTPAIYLQTEIVPGDGELVELGLDGQLHRGLVS